MHAPQALFKKFPKERPALPMQQAAIYEQEYLVNREGKTIVTAMAQRLEGWMHREVAAHVQGTHFLELGAGTLNQLPYMPKNISFYDVVEPAEFLYAESPYRSRVRHFYSDISACHESYDSIFSVATMEHVTDLPTLLARATLLLAPTGRLVNAVPCEGGALWGLSWRLSTGLAYRLRTGFSYGNVMRHEHVNQFDEILALHQHFFESVQVYYFPLPHKHFAFYACLLAERPKHDISRQYLGVA